MSAHKGRTLDPVEARRLFSIDQAARHDRSANAAIRWPGSYNLKLLAKAVKDRKMFVEFEPYMRFKIRYDSKFDAVFIKPADDGFVPCGYFSYKRLKDALIGMEDE